MAQAETLLAGFAEAEFTPPVGGNMPGLFFPMKTRDPAKGKLLASAAAFSCGGEDLILVSMDILSAKRPYMDDIRSRISKATGASMERILVAATHTHTGPALEYQLWLCPPEPETSRKTADRAVEAGIAAWRDRKPAMLGVGKGTEPRFSFNRDCVLADGSIVMNPFSYRDEEILRTAVPEIDRSVHVMRIDGEDGAVRCFIVNYANHPDCQPDEKKTFFSADFPGFLRRALKRQFGEDVKVLFFNGCAGDVNSCDFLYKTSDAYNGEGKDKPCIIGEGLAETVMAVNSTIQTRKEPVYIRSLYEICTVPHRHQTEQDRAWAKQVSESPEGRSDMDLAFAQEYLEPDSPEDTVDLTVHTVRLGPWAIVGLPSEIYTELGLKIKAESPYENTLIFELAGGTNGYISPDYIIHSKAYEGKYSKYNAYCGDGTAQKLCSHATGQLRKMLAAEQS